MKKKLLSTLLGVLMALPVLARDFSYKYEGQTLTYTVISEDDKTVKTKVGSFSTPGNDVSGNLIIPKIAKFGDVEYTVISISDYAFSGCGNLKQVIIPGSVTNVSETAFQDCVELRKAVCPSTIVSEPFKNTGGVLSYFLYNPEIVNPIEDVTKYGCIYDSEEKKELRFVSIFYTGVFNIPESVETIGGYAFSFCNELTEVTIPDSVTEIGNYAFNDCSGLTSVTIPNSVKTIGEYAFLRCACLTEVTIGNSVETIGDGAFLRCSGLTEVTIPNSVKTIGEYAFQLCENLSSITLSSSLTAINSYAFSKTGLISVEIPSGVTSIGEAAFWDCSGLTSVIIGDSVKIIGAYAFYNCYALTSVTIPNSVESIGNYAFRDCTGLTSVIIGNSVKTLGSEAFRGCSGLTSLAIGISVKSIGSNAFDQCDNLRKVACIEELSDNFSNIEFKIVYDKSNSRIDDGFVFSRRKDHIYFAPTSLSANYELPETVETIGEGAFSYCTGLTSVKLNDALISIGENAFADCNSISVVEYPSNTPAEATGNIFTISVFDHATLYVPKGSLKIFEKTTPWNYFYNIEEKDFSIISVSSLSFKQSNYAAEVGKTLDLNDEVVILPADATDKSLVWTSSDESVATVSNGVVTVLAEGSCEITATTTDGSNLSAVCSINASSVIESVMAADELCDVYNMSGVLIHRDAALKDITLSSGVYIIRKGRVVNKVLVK